MRWVFPHLHRHQLQVLARQLRRLGPKPQLDPRTQGSLSASVLMEPLGRGIGIRRLFPIGSIGFEWIHQVMQSLHQSLPELAPRALARLALRHSS
jgi:hypothetical protein